MSVFVRAHRRGSPSQPRAYFGPAAVIRNRQLQIDHRHAAEKWDKRLRLALSPAERQEAESHAVAERWTLLELLRDYHSHRPPSAFIEWIEQLPRSASAAAIDDLIHRIELETRHEDAHSDFSHRAIRSRRAYWREVELGHRDRARRHDELAATADDRHQRDRARADAAQARRDALIAAIAQLRQWRIELVARIETALADDPSIVQLDELIDDTDRERAGWTPPPRQETDR